MPGACRQCGGKLAAKKRREKRLNWEWAKDEPISVHTRWCPDCGLRLTYRRRPHIHLACANKHYWKTF